MGLDFSELMLAEAGKRFSNDERIELVEHDLSDPLPTFGRFDAVVSSFAIHHLKHERKRSLYGEIFDLLEPGGSLRELRACGVANPSSPRCLLRGDCRAT